MRTDGGANPLAGRKVACRRPGDGKVALTVPRKKLSIPLPYVRSSEKTSRACRPRSATAVPALLPFIIVDAIHPAGRLRRRDGDCRWPSTATRALHDLLPRGDTTACNIMRLAAPPLSSPVASVAAEALCSSTVLPLLPALLLPVDCCRCRGRRTTPASHRVDAASQSA